MVTINVGNASLPVLPASVVVVVGVVVVVAEVVVVPVAALYVSWADFTSFHQVSLSWFTVALKININVFITSNLFIFRDISFALADIYEFLWG